MLRTRVIPVLLLRGESLVKTVRFGRFTYVGDPCNTVRIFNELEVDELCVLDISATREGREPNLALLADMANECFMPLSYGGGIRSFEHAAALFRLGVEKVILNTGAIEHPEVVGRIARYYGSQAVIVAIDVKLRRLGGYQVSSRSATVLHRRDPVEWAREVERLGAGEILLTSVDREGTWNGFDVELTARVSDAVRIPVIAHGGGGTVEHIGQVVRRGGASAVGLGSMVVYQKRGMGVLVNFPDRDQLAREIS